jgi:predicted amidohydrolase
VKLSLGQFSIGWENKPVNKFKIQKMAYMAADSNAKLFCLPEMCLSGFSMNVDHICDHDNRDLAWFQDLARETGMYIGFGIVEKPDGFGRNCYYIVSPDGLLKHRYEKIHPFSHGDENKFYVSGNSLALSIIDGIGVSTFICYDLRFPEVFQAISSLASLIIVAANWPKSRKEHWITLIQARAIENQCYIAAVNRVGDCAGMDFSGDSMIVDPWGRIVFAMNNEEGVGGCEIEPEEVEKIRKTFSVKLDRRESLYVELFDKLRRETPFPEK